MLKPYSKNNKLYNRNQISGKTTAVSKRIWKFLEKSGNKILEIISWLLYKFEISIKFFRSPENYHGY